MKVSVIRAFGAIISASALPVAPVYPGQVQGQDAQPTAAISSKAQGDTSSNGVSTLPANPVCKGPAWYICPTEEEERYMHLFRELDIWDVSIKHYEDLGDKGFADHMRTKLARESSLTIEEAALVKKIADQWIKGEEERGRAIPTRTAAERAASQAAGKDPARQMEHWALVDQAIAQLVASLGSKEFSKLDLYTRHMDDRAKAAMEAGRQHALAENKDKQ